MAGVLALVFYASIVASIGISIFIGYKASLERQDWAIYGTGIVAAVIAGYLGMNGTLSIAIEQNMGFWYSVIHLPSFPRVAGGLIPLGIPGPAWFAAAFLLLARARWGGEMGRYFEIATIGLLIQAAAYVFHLAWHFQQTGGISTLPEWGISQSFWYVFFHGGAALSFGLIAYAFYGYWKTTQ
ncbi:MAG: hypothetical protein ABEK12_01740 [Candidatus Nanohaloarchaea archaeon]